MYPSIEPEKFSIYPCSWCSKWKVVERDNHHPYCSCGSDFFEWADGEYDLPWATADDLAEERNRQGY
jgi:endogenous inhibitor of DNA gyrase (YacG/DUF329 family)